MYNENAQRLAWSTLDGTILSVRLLLLGVDPAGENGLAMASRQKKDHL